MKKTDGNDLKICNDAFEILIPCGLSRRKFGWFIRCSCKQILELDTMLGNHLFIYNAPTASLSFEIFTECLDSCLYRMKTLFSTISTQISHSIPYNMRFSSSKLVICYEVQNP